MDFLSVLPSEAPKNTYQCLAVVTVGGATTGRRGSADSAGSDSREGSGLARILSGDRDSGLSRILSGGQRRRSMQGQTKPAAVAPTATEGASPEGTWYWRCRVGVTKENLVIMPLSMPANPLLTHKPPPLSSAFAEAKATPGAATHTSGGAQDNVGTKFMTGLRRASAAFIHTTPHQPAKDHVDGTTPAVAEDHAQHDTTQMPAGAHITIAEGSHTDAVESHVATNDTASVPTETGWPGVIDGEPLHGIIVPLHQLQSSKIHQGGNSKDGFHVSVSVASAIAGKAGHIRFEFDKGWIGGKGEAELLKHVLSQGVSHSSPMFTNVQLGGGGNTAAPAQHAAADTKVANNGHTDHPAPAPRSGGFANNLRKSISREKPLVNPESKKWQDEVRGKW